MGVKQDVAYYNNKFITMAEHYDQFILNAAQSFRVFFHDRIRRSAYKLFNGTEPTTNIYRGGLPAQSGLSTWKPIQLSKAPDGADPGYDNCALDTPRRYKYSYESLTYKGFKDSFQSDPICVNDIKYVDAAREQVALIIQSGVEFGISMQEVFNREMYIWTAVRAGRGLVMANGATNFQDNALFRFTYDPFDSMTDANGKEVPFLKFDSSLEVSTLNWDYLDYLAQDISRRAPRAALGVVENMPVYGLMLEYRDVEKMMNDNPSLRAVWLEAHPMALIDGYSLTSKVFRQFSVMMDPYQPRFRVHGLDGDDIVATRVEPYRDGPAATFGHKPEPNPAYWHAEIGMGIIFLQDVFENQFVPTLTSLGSGTSFGATPGLNGKWAWINNKGPNENILGETGYFYGRYEIYPKPLLASADATVFIYRRCPQTLRSLCGVEYHSDVGTGAVAVEVDAVAADYDGTNRRVTLKLAKVLAAGPGDPVTIKKADSDSFTAIILESSSPTVYTFGWKDGVTNAPTAYGNFTAATSTVTVQ